MAKNKNTKYGTSLAITQGPIPYTLTNDYLFYTVFRKCTSALRALLAALLGLAVEAIGEIVYQDTKLRGKDIGDKDYVLDLLVFVNNMWINLEMQVRDYHNWLKRSIAYAGRLYGNQLEKGEDYDDVLAVIHVGIVNFDPFKNRNKFFARYHLMDDEDHFVFSSSFELQLLDLSSLQQATDRDRSRKLDLWGRAFLATDWGEIRALAQLDPIFEEVGNTMAAAIADPKMRRTLQKREDARQLQIATEHTINEAKDRAEKAEKEKAAEKAARKKAEKRAEKAEKAKKKVKRALKKAEEEAAAVKAENERLKKLLEKKDKDADN